MGNSSRNLTEQIRGPLIGIGFKLLLAISHLRPADTFPVTERRVLDRSAVFNDTSTFYNYTLHLQKVCFFLDTSTAWITPAVRQVA